ncbi:MAG: cation-transporting P-type ATPase [Chloroflexi bacterium]|nr:cation-transporting P-type ATPase [Chloroflexota bacterium]
MQEILWHAQAVDDVLAQFHTSREGLTSEEAAARLARYGGNITGQVRGVSPVRLLLRQFSNFFILVLFVAAGLAYAVGFIPGQQPRTLDAIFILFIIAVTVTLGFIEEYRAQRELTAIRQLLADRAVVLRDGRRLEISAADIVPGDILVLSAGQKVPADGRLVEAHALRADEAALTGESVAVDKGEQPVAPDAPLAERSSMVYGGTYITHGSGLAVVVRTGQATEMGRIATSLREMAERPTPFQVEVQKMARQMTVIVGTLAVVVALVLLFILHAPLIEVALNTLSLAVATIPASLPMVLTFALALGAREMARRRAVVRRLSVAESLGSVDTICTDKTGTLTQSTLAVQRLFADGQVMPFPLPHSNPDGTWRELLLAGLLCNEASLEGNTNHASRQSGINELPVLGDPVDVALLRAAQAAGLDVEAERRAYPRVKLIPFDSERMRMTTVHQAPGDGAGHYLVFAKGALRAVLSRCDRLLEHGQIVPLTEERREDITNVVRSLQDEGWYVLALASGEISSAEDDGILENEEVLENGLVFLGLQAMIDPPRPEAKPAIAACREAGIRLIMITGDNALTARAVGRELGLGERAIEGDDLESVSVEERRRRLKGVDIVARATPQTKQQVLETLQSEGHFVAMTGDGVNDAIALKQADVGVAMGQRGADIAKESASMVLLDDNFATIAAAIEEGRRIFDNIRKFTNYLLSTSLAEVFEVLILSVAGYFPLNATMLLWVNVVTDLVPASALAGDPAVPGIMKRRPRRHDEPILNRAIYAVIAGSVFRTVIAYTFLFAMGLRLGDVAYARTILFTAIVLHAFTRVMVVRQMDSLSLWSNPTLLGSYAVSVALQLVALYTPLRVIFGAVPLDLRAWLLIIPVVAGSSLAGVYMTRWILRLVPLWD